MSRPRLPPFSAANQLRHTSRQERFQPGGAVRSGTEARAPALKTEVILFPLIDLVIGAPCVPLSAGEGRGVNMDSDLHSSLIASANLVAVFSWTDVPHLALKGADRENRQDPPE